MNISKVIVVVSIFLIFVLVVTFIVCKGRITEKKMQEDIVVDDFSFKEEESRTKDLKVSEYLTFTVYDENNNEINLSEYEKKPIAILFFIDKEKDSIAVLDKFDSFYVEYKDKINFLMIDVSQDVNNELKEKYSFPIYYDFYKQATRNYNVTEYPAMIYISYSEENGKDVYTITNSKIGVPSSDAIEANLDIISGNY